MKLKQAVSMMLLIALLTISLTSCNMEKSRNDSISSGQANGNTPNQTNKTAQDKTPTKGETTNESEPEKKYSDLLQSILSNSHYNSLIAQAEAGNFDIYERGEFKPHPYAFLEKEGFDVDAIKAGDLDCHTLSYVLDEEPNNLYMRTQVNDGAVVTSYLLKYELTDQERYDYNFTHDDPNSAINYYVQAVFMNNEISKMKTPTVIGKSRSASSNLASLKQSIEKTHNLKSKLCYPLLLNPNANDYTFDLIILPKYYVNEQMVHDAEIIFEHCKTKYKFEAGSIDSPESTSEYITKSISRKNATVYLTQDAPLTYTRCKTLVNPTIK